MATKPTAFVIYYSMFGHVQALARNVMQGLESSGVNSKLFQIAETLSPEVLAAMHAPPKANDVPVITTQELSEADGYLFGVPTRFGTTPQQVKALFDQCGSLWTSGALNGKLAGTFFSTATLGGGQETTALSCIPFFTHMGICYVPFGYKSSKLNDISHAHGGSPWGSGALSGMDNAREVSELELELATVQGMDFGNLLKKFCAHKSH